MSRPLPSPRQRELLDWIKAFIDKTRYAPTLEEMAAGLGLRSLSTVHKHLCRLRELGYVTWERSAYRSIRVIPEPCSDTALLDALERFVRSNPLTLWNGQGEFPLISKRLGLSLLSGQSLRQVLLGIVRAEASR